MKYTLVFVLSLVAGLAYAGPPRPGSIYSLKCKREVCDPVCHVVVDTCMWSDHCPAPCRTCYASDGACAP